MQESKKRLTNGREIILQNCDPNKLRSDACCFKVRHAPTNSKTSQRSPKTAANLLECAVAMELGFSCPSARNGSNPITLSQIRTIFVAQNDGIGMNRHTIFVVSANSSTLGSAVMRSEQLMRTLEQAADPNLYSFSVECLPTSAFSRLRWLKTRPRQSLLFFTKPTLHTISNKLIRVAELLGHKTALDHVDSDLTHSLRLNPSIHIAASLSQFDHLNRTLKNSGSTVGKVRLIHHAPDSSINELKAYHHIENCMTVYFGNIENALLTPEIRRRIVVVRAGNRGDFVENKNKLETYNCHYCLRSAAQPSKSLVFKPFTKGFTAAAMGAVILASRDDVEAVRLLGPDYPYLTPDTSESSALAILAHATQSFRTETWEKARSRVEQLNELVTPGALFRQFTSIYSER